MSIKIGLMSTAHMHMHSYAGCVKRISNATLVGVADSDKERGVSFANEFETEFYPSYEALLEQDIDAVIVGSENVLHKGLVEMAAEAGKHILCEKPMCTTIEDALSILDACHSNSVKLMIAFPCRFSPAAISLEKIIRNHEIGDVLAIKSTNHGKAPGGWFTDIALSGGGAVMDHTMHVVDLMRWMLASEPARVYAEISNKLNHGDYDDTGMLSVNFANDTFATLDTSWSRPQSFPIWGDVTMKVIGSEGCAELNLFSQTINQYSDSDMRVYQHGYGTDIDEAMISDFTRCIEEDLPVSISGEDGLRALEVAVAAYKSSECGKPITLPLTN